jgi:hypothetical protein
MKVDYWDDISLELEVRRVFILLDSTVKNSPTPLPSPARPKPQSIQKIERKLKVSRCWLWGSKVSRERPTVMCSKTNCIPDLCYFLETVTDAWYLWSTVRTGGCPRIMGCRFQACSQLKFANMCLLTSHCLHVQLENRWWDFRDNNNEFTKMCRHIPIAANFVWWPETAAAWCLFWSLSSVGRRMTNFW